MDIAITMETPLDIATSVQTVDRAASVEHLQDVVESVKPQLDLVEPSEMQDGCVVENAEILLDNAEGDDSQLEDLPQNDSILQKETLQHFLSLREMGKVPAYITPEHMRDWIISEGRNILRERFQREGADQKDSLIHLVWEVNMRLKMQDIYRELGLTTSSSTPLSDEDTQQAALSDL
ncbi:hypothetical protein AAFF_G00407430 [Aldrovandia affinis]|uniref:Uncharacterized protein n=1 Tax=Aldrovandia affinis TaxID=143900 RepID=A0AAD7R3J3_9TELE|nr:hypothetical protein AAFF_G00407430 [Aldrovandia affinis]